MRLDQIAPGRPLTPTRTAASHQHHGHELSRRGFLRPATQVTVAGAAFGAGLMRPGAARASGPGIGLVEPIPTTDRVLPRRADPTSRRRRSWSARTPIRRSVNNFRGASAIAFISGTVERHDRRTGETRTLPYRVQ